MSNITAANVDAVPEQHNLRSNKSQSTASSEQHSGSDAVNDPPKKRRRLNQPRTWQARENATSDDQAMEAATFLDLPPEVRNMIYSYYFDGLYVIIQSDVQSRTYDSGTKGVPTQDHLWKEDDKIQVDKEVWPLFLSNKTIAYEVRQIFYTSATFVFADAQCFIDAVQNSLISGLPQKIPGDLMVFNSLKTLRRVWLHFVGKSYSSGSAMLKADKNLENTWLLALKSIPAVEILNMTVEYTPSRIKKALRGFLLRQAFLRDLYELRNLQQLSISATSSKSSPVSPEHGGYVTIATISKVYAKYFEKNARAGQSGIHPELDHFSVMVLQVLVVNDLIEQLCNSNNQSNSEYVVELIFFKVAALSFQRAGQATATDNWL